MGLLQTIHPASRLAPAAIAPAWGLGALKGQISELSGSGATTLAMGLAWEAQRQGEPIAWITTRRHSFYPPDAEANGLDLDALAVVRLEDPHHLGKAADTLVRSGAFGLVVLDLGKGGTLPDRQLTRLLGLARKHTTALVCLNDRPADAPSLGSVVSLRLQVRHQRIGPGMFACQLLALKEKRRAPGWRHEEVVRGPAGLR